MLYAEADELAEMGGDAGPEPIEIPDLVTGLNLPEFGVGWAIDTWPTTRTDSPDLRSFDST